MKVDMLMPQMGESITEATIVKWLKTPGSPVKKDEIILEISTDKVDSEIPAPATGTLVEVAFAEGAVVPVKQKIAVIDTDASAGTVATTTNVTEQPKVTPIQEVKKSASIVLASDNHAIQVEPQIEADRFISPVVRNLAVQYGISLAELETIPGTGHGNRLTKQDFNQYLNSRNVNTKPSPTMRSDAPVRTEPTPVKTPSVNIPGTDWQPDGTKIVPMDNMRRSIAEHMVRSKHTSPHVYSIQEVDVTKISTWRTKYKNQFNEKEGFNLSFTPFFLEATVKALLEFPYVNSSVSENTVILKKHINLGCAVALGNTGLIVPVIRNAEEKNLVGLARALNDLANRARTKKLLPNEVMDGTFTVTNPGVFGTIIGTPIINQPQVAILCLGAIEKRPVVVNDMIGIRERCYLTLTYDHRIVDGAIGGQFLKFVCDYLENWDAERGLY